MSGSSPSSSQKISEWLKGVPEGPAPVAESSNNPSRIVVVGVDLPFGDLVTLYLKMAFAAIPAAIIIAGVWFVVGALLQTAFR